MNLNVLQEKIIIAFNVRNLATMGGGLLLLALFALGLLLPAHREVARLEAAIPEEGKRVARTRDIHTVEKALRGKLEEMQNAAVPVLRQLGPEYADSPVAVRRLAARYGVEVRALSLELPAGVGQRETMKLRMELAGDLARLRNLVADLVRIPSLVGMERIKIGRERDVFSLAITLIVADE
jgi:hypothetical protein